MRTSILIAKGLCAAILAVLLAAMVYAHFRSEHLSRQILRVVQSHLATELDAGEFRIDVLTTFPNIRAVCRDVRLQGIDDSLLMRASEVSMTLSLVRAIFGDVHFRRLNIVDADIYVSRLANGTLSLDVLKPSTGDGIGAALHFHTILLQNTRVHYADPDAVLDCALHFHNARLRGKSGHRHLDFTLHGDIKTSDFSLDHQRYLHGAGGSIKGRFALDLAGGLFAFHDLVVRLDQQHISLDGTIRQAEDYNYLDLRIEQKESGLDGLVALLPLTLLRDLPVSTPEGKFSTKGFIRGRLGNGENPEIHFDFHINDGKIDTWNRGDQLHDINVQATVHNGPFRRLSGAVLTVHHFSGRHKNRGVFNGTLTLSDLADPVLTCAFDGSLSAGFIFGITGSPFDCADGMLYFDQVYIGGLSLGRADFTDLGMLTGRCVPKDLVLCRQGEQYRVQSGDLRLHRDSLFITDLEVRQNTSLVRAEGWLTGLGDAIQGRDVAYLHYGLTIVADALELTPWITKGQDAQEAHVIPSVVRPVSSRIAAPLRMPRGTVQISAEEFRYTNHQMQDFSGVLTTATHHMDFTCTFRSMEGMLDIKGTLNTRDGYAMNLQISGKRFDIQQCFTRFDNFHQHVLRSEHLSGRVDVKALAELKWDLSRRFNKDALQVIAAVSISDGELKDFDMLESFSTYCHAEDLRNVRFERLDNFLEVRSGNVYLPAMFIQSNAANLTINGVHTFDNRILYNIKINAGQVMTAKLKRHNPRLDPLPARDAGRFNLFYTIEGSLDDYRYGANRRGVQSSFDQSALIRDRIRDRLAEVFGTTVEMLEPLGWQTIPEYELEVRGEDVFLDLY